METTQATLQQCSNTTTTFHTTCRFPSFLYNHLEPDYFTSNANPADQDRGVSGIQMRMHHPTLCNSQKAPTSHSSCRHRARENCALGSARDSDRPVDQAQWQRCNRLPTRAARSPTLLLIQNPSPFSVGVAFITFTGHTIDPCLCPILSKGFHQKVIHYPLRQKSIKNHLIPLLPTSPSHQLQPTVHNRHLLTLKIPPRLATGESLQLWRRPRLG